MAINTLCKSVRNYNFTRIISCNLNLTTYKNKLNQQSCLLPRVMLSDSDNLNINLNYNKCYCNIGIDDPVKIKKKKVFVPRITLLSEKDEISIVTLEAAQKLASRHNMKLVKIVDFDTKTERPVYKLMTLQEFIQSELKSKAEAKEAKEKAIKEDKTIAVSSKIAEHDLHIKIKSMIKMLGKRHGVRVVIAVDGNKEKAENVRNMIIDHCKEHAKAQAKSDTALNLKVTLRPIINKLNQEPEESVNKLADNNMG
ncbi:translation initiation factor IF-3 [Microplitis mediator]|uniref:translation initiation factor IF-3 n=1 Tax=Microplitis mediator TaxID=375433 RepID=UPI0025527C6F|nr:translation initiation factor IF-3 [Microplitis mediator]